MIVAQIRDLCVLPNCAGIKDGTLFPLAFCPQTTDSPDCKGRKYRHTLSGVIICDDKRMMQCYHVGWPRSTHDNQMFWNTMVATQPHSHFDQHQCIMGDSAFVNEWFSVSAFACPPGQHLDFKENTFDKALSKARVVSKHTIGMLKGRFPWLRSIHKLMTDNLTTLTDVLLHVEVTVVPHYLMTKEGLEDDIDEYSNDISIPNDCRQLPDADKLIQEVHNSDVGDLQRTQLMPYLLEREVDEA